ncbi:hypothetical protein Q7C36_012245 [Tachysurus vachellii]|uniref:Uncharacterized protein n=1 Tax=Tachysurus vachellii TaxID=175792 RepID=A0AA88MQQ2_TACVA|nr:hypothetical protein Q7C36_012245 [Tachysurus vachellii]
MRHFIVVFSANASYSVNSTTSNGSSSGLSDATPTTTYASKTPARQNVRAQRHKEQHAGQDQNILREHDGKKLLWRDRRKSQACQAFKVQNRFSDQHMVLNHVPLS